MVETTETLWKRSEIIDLGGRGSSIVRRELAFFATGTSFICIGTQSMCQIIIIIELNLSNRLNPQKSTWRYLNESKHT